MNRYRFSNQYDEDIKKELVNIIKEFKYKSNLTVEKLIALTNSAWSIVLGEEWDD